MSVFRWLTYPFKRQARQPLAYRRPDRAEMGQERGTPLGMEATDMGLVDTVNRRNDALERATQIRHEDKESYAAQSSLQVKAMPENETYARRYYTAFMRKGQTNE